MRQPRELHQVSLPHACIVMQPLEVRLVPVLDDAVSESCAWLGRHGPQTQLHWDAAPSDIGDELLIRASRLEAYLVVMGTGTCRWPKRCSAA